MAKKKRLWRSLQQQPMHVNVLIAIVLVCALLVVVQHPSIYVQEEDKNQEVVSALLFEDGGRKSRRRTIVKEGREREIPELLQHQPVPAVDLLKETDLIYSDVYHSPIVIEDYKLIFFDVYKNACTGWKILFHKMMGKEWTTQQPLLGGHGHIGQRRWGPLHAPRKNALLYLYNYNLSYANTIMQDPTWTRAIFVRNPHERFLSAYLFLKQPKTIHLLRKACCQNNQNENGNGNHTTSNNSNSNCTRVVPSFDEFAKMIQSYSCQYADKHWEAQSLRMDAKYWKYVNFVGRHENLIANATTLLRQIGAWDTYGKYVTGTGDAMNENETDDDTDTVAIESVFGSTGGQHHKTGASKRMQHYYNSNNREVYDLVTDYYRHDYDHPTLEFELLAPSGPKNS